MKPLILSVAGIILAAATSLQAAVSTWSGTTSSAWTNAANWSPGIPADGDDVVIADSTSSGNSMNLTDSRTIGNFQFGTTGTRITTFQITNNVAANTLTITNGFTATGALPTTEFSHVPIVIANDQTWNIGGSAGSATVDAGIRLRERTTGNPTVLTLNGTLTKTGSGQLSFVGQNVGNGNIIVNQGSLKLNAGGTTLLTVGGTGSITVNGGASLMISRNSGTWNFSKAVVLNSGSTIQIGGGTPTSLYPFPVTWNGNVNLTAITTGTELNILSGTWSGTAAISVANGAAQQVSYILSNNIAGLSGSLNHAANLLRISFAAPAPGNPAVAWSLNNAGAILETLGALNISLGSLSGASGTLRNSDPTSQPAVATVGALGTSTTFGGVIADNTASLALVKVGAGTLTLTGNNTYGGGTTVSNGAILLQGATAAAGSGGVTVRSGAAFGGSGTANGAVSVDSGGTVEGLGGAGSPTLTVGSLNLGASGADTTTVLVNVYLGGKIADSGNLIVNGTTTVNIAGAAPAVGIYDLVSYAGGSIGGAGFGGVLLGTLPFGVVAHLEDSGAAIRLNVTAVTIEPGIWAGNVLGQWNLAGGLEWKGATSGNPQPYHDLDVVTFDSSASNFTVNVTANVTPASISVNNSASAYTFSGVAGIIGSAPLSKDGPGTLTIVNSNAYTGGTYISNGVVSLGNGGASGSISGNILDNGGLVLNRSDAVTLAGSISGIGSIEQRGSGIAALAGANTYTGPTTVTSGTLAAGSGTALGDIAAGTTVANGATLDVNSQNLGAEPITALGAGVGGRGAIVNNGPADSQNATRFVTLTGPTTFGGATRWDIRDPSPATNPGGGVGAFLIGNGNALTKVSSNVVAFINAGDTALADINILGGTLTFSRSTFLGDSTKKIAVYPGATLQFHRTSEFLDNALNKVVAITNATMAAEANGLTNRFVGPVTFSGSNTVSLPAATGISLENTVDGDGSVTAAGGGLLAILGAATYTGGTTLGGATLRVDGSLGTGAHPLLITAPSTIGGNGTILDPVTLPAGSTLSPGDSIGALTLSGALVLSPGCSNLFEINKDLATNDVVRGLTSVALGGTLFVNNIGSTGYAPGDNFKLFYAGSYSGSFSSVVPATPALGLIWVTNNLPVNGTLSVAVLPTPIPLFALSASSLVSTSINVFFTAALDPGPAQNPANYSLTISNQVVSATLVTPTNVLLGLDAPITNASFKVRVQAVRDLAFIPNVVATTNVPGVAIDFLEAFSVLITNGSAFAYGTNGQIKVYSDGVDIFGTQDHFEFVYKYFTNDFDVAVTLESLLVTDPAAKAGIMARDVTDPTFPLFDDRHYLVAGFTADPSRNNNFSQFRESQGASAIAPGAPRPGATYPNNWLRLKRTGSILEGFSGPNGLDWTAVTAVDSATNAPGAYPGTIRVGLAVTAHNAAQTTEAIFSHFGKAVDRVALTAVESGGNLLLSWPASGIGATLQATPDLTPPITWTNIPGSTITNVVVSPIGPGRSFFRLAQ